MGTETTKAATAVVIDPQPLRREHARTLLKRHGIEVVAVASAVDRAAELAEIHGCELLLVGLAGGAEPRAVYGALRKAHKRCAGLVTVVLAEPDDSALIESALAAGAFAAVDRSSSMQAVARVARDALAEQRGDGGRAPACRARLTRREIEILRLVAEGRSNREVAKLLWVTDQTVKFHLANTYRKLGVRNRVEASQWAFARGLVRPEAAMTARVQLPEIVTRAVVSRRTQGDAVAVTP